MMEHRSRLPSISLKQVFRNARLSSEQLAKLCGISRRQLSYWIENGFVPPPGDDPLATIERASLINLRLQQGDTFRQALQTVADYYESYHREKRRLEAMSDEERSQQMAKELEELQVQIGKLRQILSSSDPAPFSLRSLMTTLRYLALEELFARLPHSRPTPDLIIRIRQSASRLSLFLQTLPGQDRESQRA